MKSKSKPCRQFIIPMFQAGANMIVSGSAVMKSDNPRQVIGYMRQAVDDAISKANLER